MFVIFRPVYQKLRAMGATKQVAGVSTLLFTVIVFGIPAIITHLDLLITTNALLLLPLGAFIFIDLWLFPKLGLQPNFAAKTGVMISWAAAAAWIIPMILSLIAFRRGANPIFLVLPEWIVSVLLYIVFSFIQQKTSSIGQPVNTTN